MSQPITLSKILSVVVALSVFCPVQFGQPPGQKGMTLEKTPRSSVPCGSIVTPPDQKEGAKGLFFDPASGVALNSNPSAASQSFPPRQQVRNRLKSKEKPVPSPIRTSPTISSDQTTSIDRPALKVENTGLKFWIELIESNGDTKRVLPIRTFHTGERVRFHFESNVDGFIALTLLEAAGTAKTLFPSPQLRDGDNFIEREKDTILPAEDAWFRFDNQPGTERILVFFSRSRQAIDRLQLEPEMAIPSVAMLKKNAQEGSKGIVIEFDQALSRSQPAAYFVNPSPDSSTYVVLEICLNHEP